MPPIDSADQPQSEAVYEDINDSQRPTQIESMCMNCEQNGVTTLLLTKIPFYKEVILMSFRCENCGFTNCELQSGSKIQERGITFDVTIKDVEDLNRQVVKADTATISVPEINLEVPPHSQKGVVTTVEGILKRTIDGLMQDQPVRKHMAPKDAETIDEYVEKIQKLLQVQEPFHVILTDPSGNGFVQNRFAPEPDRQRLVTQFTRTKEQDHELGIYSQQEIDAPPNGQADDSVSMAPLASTEASSSTSATESTVTEESTLVKGMTQLTATDVSQKLVRERAAQLVGDSTTLDLESEVLVFHDNCPSCNAPCKTNMKITQIPHFKEVVIMSTLCDHCGHKTNEVKSGGGIEPKGKKITLQVKNVEDLSRDLLKSETCAITIPELKFEMGGFALGGRFTTLEGLLANIDDQVLGNPLFGSMLMGDSANEETKKKMQDFREKLEKMKRGEENFTLVLDDPAGNSYLQDLCLPEEDPQLTIEHYERSFDQNEDLGINDMKTENYGEEQLAKVSKEVKTD